MTYQPPYGKLRNDTSGTGPSVALWKYKNHNDLALDGNNDGFDLYDTFENAGSGVIASNVGGWGGYKTYEDTGGSIAVRDASPRELRMTTDNTDNDSVSIQGAGSLGRQAVITDTAGAMRQVICEARLSVGQIGNAYNWFFGLAQPGCAANDGFFTDAGALPDKDFIGFWALEADGDAINFGYKKEGQTAQTLAVVKVPVANTKFKVGFISDPRFPDASKIVPYVDGVIDADGLITAAMIAAATFPDGEGLALFSEVKNQTTTASIADYTFWRLSCSGIVA